MFTRSNAIFFINKLKETIMLEHSLPRSIWQLIYAFDPTFHDTFIILKKEFHQKMSFWGLQWSHYLQRNIRYHESQQQMLTLEHYYSHHCDNNGQMHPRCTATFLTDHLMSRYARIFQHLRDLRQYHWDDNHQCLHKYGAKKNSLPTH